MFTSAVIYAGLTYGWLFMLTLVLLYAAAVIGMLRHPQPAVVALVAQLPSVLTVAFITQYSAFFWFVAGLAVSALAERVNTARAERRAVESGHLRPTLARTAVPSGPRPSEGEGTQEDR